MEGNTQAAALSDLVVLEIDNGRASYAGKLLADMGADVLKVEPPEGDPARHVGPFADDWPDVNGSLSFWHYNTSKRSVTLNLSSDTGRVVFRRLAARADVVLDGLGPEVMRGHGLGYEELSQENPRLIYAHVTPFGVDGPWSSYEASDLVHLALGGPAASTGYDDDAILYRGPIAPLGGQAMHMGSIIAAIGVMAAVEARSKDGRGQLVDIATHEAISVSTEAAVPYWELQREHVVRHTARHASVKDRTPRWVWPTRDGKYFCALTLYLTDQRFTSLVQWFESEHMAEDLTDERYMTESTRTEEMEHVAEVIGRFCAVHDAATLFHEAQARRLPWAPVNAPEDLAYDAHLMEDRKAFANVWHGERHRSFKYAGMPYRFTGTPWRALRPPLLGEHTLDVLKTLGTSESDYNQWKSRGIV